MRVGIISIQHESNTFCRPPTQWSDFERDLLAAGPEMRRRYERAHHEVGGFFEGLEKHGIEPVGIFAAWTVPGGTITADCFEALVDQLMRELRAAGPLDGVLAAPHGAAVAERYPDADGHWLTLLRRELGPRRPLIATLDLHANLSAAMAGACDVLVAYRTNPHLDQRQRGIEAAELMARTLRGETSPQMAVAFPPVVINIERQSTGEAPCRELFAVADRLRQRRPVLSNSVVLGFPYADVPEMGASVVAVADGDRVAAQHAADELAEYLVAHRSEFVGVLVGVDDALNRAMNMRVSVCLLDMGDNIGGGSPGDGTVLAHALHARRCNAFICLCDRRAVERARAAGTGVELEMDIGGRTDALHGPPLRVRARVRSLHAGRFTESQPRHGGQVDYDMGRTAVLDIAGGLTLMVTSRRTPPMSLNQLTSCGLRPEMFQMIVAKGVHAPVAAYRQVCREFVRVNTPGVTTADLSRLHYNHRRRPLYPFEEIA